jgi:hypothetical protein
MGDLPTGATKLAALILFHASSPGDPLPLADLTLSQGASVRAFGAPVMRANRNHAA